MTRQTATQTQQQTTTTSLLSRGGILQRQCESCGQHMIAGGECVECGKQKSRLQRKLTIGASNDPLEREADQVANQVLAAPGHSVVSAAPPCIQHYAGQTTERLETAPASIDRVLASSGRPLESVLLQDMEQRFGHDFSRVRVHTGADAEQSALDVNAHAYTVGHNIVFGAGRFAPDTNNGQLLIAHELTHVVQQADSGGAAFDRFNNRGVSPVGLGNAYREQDRGCHHETETNAVYAAVDKGSKLPAISAGADRILFRSPRPPGESEKEQQKAGVAGLNKPISTASDSTEGFDLNLAQRGFDFVGNLQSAIARNKQRIAELEKQSAAASTAAERDKLNAKITKQKEIITRNENTLRLVSTPQLIDFEALAKEQKKLTDELVKNPTPAKKVQIEKKLANINQQIKAVEFVKANPDATAPLNVFKGQNLGFTFHTYVTVQVITAEGEVHVFQARNVPGGDHAEDVVMKQMESVGLTKGNRLAGAKMTVFGDQEVCARCQERLPKFAEMHGVDNVEGYTTHAPTLDPDSKATIRAKRTSLGASNPTDVGGREKAQSASGQIGKGETLTTVQKKTFDWKNPASPSSAGGGAPYPPTTKSNAVSSSGTAFSPLLGVKPIAQNVPIGDVPPVTPPSELKPASPPKLPSTALAGVPPILPTPQTPGVPGVPSNRAKTGTGALPGSKQKFTITVPSQLPPEFPGLSAKGEAIGAGFPLILDAVRWGLDKFAAREQRIAAEKGWESAWPEIQKEITRTGKGVVVYFEYTRYGDSSVLVYEGIHWSSGGNDPGQPAAIRGGGHASFSRTYVGPKQEQASITDETALEFRRTELRDRQRVYQNSAERMSKEGWVGQKLLERAGSHLDPRLTYDAKAHIVSASEAIKQKRFSDATQSLDLAEKALDEMREQFKAYMGPGKLD